MAKKKKTREAIKVTKKNVKNNDIRADTTSSASALATPQKRQKTAATQKPLHTLTKVEALTNSDAWHAVNTGCLKNKNIWDRKEFEAFEKVREQADQKQYHGTRESFSRAELAGRCAREFDRGVAAKSSRDLLQRLLNERCGGGSQGGCPPPIMAWERWQASAKLGEQLQRSSSCEQSPLQEWLLPTQHSPREAESSEDLGAQSLRADLGRLPGLTEAAADEIAAGLLRHSARRAEALSRAGRNKAASRGAAQSKDTKVEDLPSVKQCKHSLDIEYRTKLLKLNIPHLEKLKQLFSHNHGGGSSLAGNEDPVLFNGHLYIMLQRYHSLLGHGMQCSCSEHVFDALKETLQVNFECFASPLNCRFPRYCSAFPDTDAVFGSLGSFFDCFRSRGRVLELFPEGGSFEANPPFIPRLMGELFDQIERLLTAKRKDKLPLSFTLVLPGWKEQAYWRKISDESREQSALVKAFVPIAAADHGFVDGAQHQRKDRLLDSTFDTALVVLQNKAGAKKFRVPDDFAAKMRDAFRKSLPTQAMRERRFKEGRGLGDRDGAGGIYKGKKQNRKYRPTFGSGKVRWHQGKSPHARRSAFQNRWMQ